MNFVHSSQNICKIYFSTAVKTSETTVLKRLADVKAAPMHQDLTWLPQTFKKGGKFLKEKFEDGVVRPSPSSWLKPVFYTVSRKAMSDDVWTTEK